MNDVLRYLRLAMAALALALPTVAHAQPAAGDPLASWNDAKKQGWLVVSMKRDFRTVFAFGK